MLLNKINIYQPVPTYKSGGLGDIDCKRTFWGPLTYLKIKLLNLSFSIQRKINKPALMSRKTYILIFLKNVLNINLILQVIVWINAMAKKWHTSGK